MTTLGLLTLFCLISNGLYLKKKVLPNLFQRQNVKGLRTTKTIPMKNTIHFEIGSE